MKTPAFLPLASAALAIMFVVGCAEQTKVAVATPVANPMMGRPELAGAWYQVYFDANEFLLDARGRMIVQSIAYAAVNSGDTRVTVMGKTDRSGEASANMVLSRKRADSVRDALISDGVPAAHINTSWTGETRQDVSTADDTVEARNRVVDVTVVNHPR